MSLDKLLMFSSPRLAVLYTASAKLDDDLTNISDRKQVFQPSLPEPCQSLVEIPIILKFKDS